MFGGPKFRETGFGSPGPPVRIRKRGPGVARDGGERRMYAATPGPGETLGTLYNIHVG